MINDDEEFFKDLPDCKPKKRGYCPGVTKQMKLEAKKRMLQRAYNNL